MVFSSTFSQDSTRQNVIIGQNTTQKTNKKRLITTLSVGGVAYLGSGYSLYQSWYKDYPRSSFHFHNDWNEWRNVDKTGHLFSAYFQSAWSYDVWRWTGMSPKGALWASAGTSILAQTTIEVFDGFSEEWGFSATDFAANTLGTGLFVAQQSIWGTQKIILKTSSSPIDYRSRYEDPLVSQTAETLYGRNLTSRFLKDYNAQTTWASFNVRSFMPESKMPTWLNVAVGYGAENLFGGFDNRRLSTLDQGALPRYSQIFISLDADLSKVETDSPFLRTMLDVLNVIKVPFSTIEINTLGEVRFHIIYF